MTAPVESVDLRSAQGSRLSPRCEIGQWALNTCLGRRFAVLSRSENVKVGNSEHRCGEHQGWIANL